MKRRTFALAAALAAAPPASFLSALPAHAPTGAKNYKELKPPVLMDTPAGQIEVIEFFSYVCPFCKKFEPTFEAWIKTVPKDVAVRRVHVGWNLDGLQGEPLQRIYYSLEALGQVDALQAKVYTALQDQHIRLNQTDVLFAWVAMQGVDRTKFEQAYKSFGVANQIQRANLATDAYRIEGTPGMGVGGRFSTDIGMTRGADPMIKLVNTLIDQVRRHG
ncbi:MAG: thiol:disulfide interchange protein DsbA/DsbL [Burkholderiaceae bacterium]|jgi:thiol:disulfide interchange protein DsbA|nr:thiol:disulfide interchange protein DsbA/DsbL [Burkholderiaceae bacterium]